MDFWIQASNPRPSGSHDVDDESISEALETAFPLDTEAGIMVWHHQCIALSYKLDLSVMIFDILEMVTRLMDETSGDFTVHWASNTFASKWALKWDAEQLAVCAEWHSVVGASEQALNQKPQLAISKSGFVAEWRELLVNALAGLRACSYTPDELSGMQRLESTIRRIGSSGVLYR